LVRTRRTAISPLRALPLRAFDFLVSAVPGDAADVVGAGAAGVHPHADGEAVRDDDAGLRQRNLLTLVVRIAQRCGGRALEPRESSSAC
jgi:hypothetical protein